MKTRVITAVVALALFVPILFFLPTWVLALVCGVLMAVGVWELLYATGSCPKHLFLYLSCAAAFAVPQTLRHADAELWPFLTVCAIYMMAAFACAVFDHEKIRYEMLGKGFLAAIILPLCFSAVLRIRNGEHGALLVLMPWITVWMCDSFALFTGMAFGKHKLAPYVSPKKTVEGAVGGLIFATLSCIGYAVVMNRCFDLQMAIWPAILFGVIGSTAGQIGDLSLSVIKRGAGIKDYGNLFPGHGGVWDRLDSILFAAPVFELLYLHILPRIGG
ncbi:MAG: phosphatidate cytidylyltransferase [Clostridia bacterium]|nr:phosphatidate cytidylyltransferase [Clostridia bacterium]